MKDHVKFFEGRRRVILECGHYNLHVGIFEKAWSAQEVAEQYFSEEFKENRWALLTGKGPDNPILETEPGRFFIAATSMKAAGIIWHALNPKAEPAYSHYTTSVNFIEHGE